ncbi:predicted protein [Chaetomium globosum CBS 148.51]|uniref:Helicase C-terminal domain-containing protein n=1 Tax=Chaetomium globosum (strain ATCC 6205 / CBS 148.51 / DSM 1962 / NBRC 6347 / NRRL 1970) TaxID=306901 RepID=Q2H4D9_CHAGB|nr:uncharacterized protein CHGG_06476 [Chaetomium globosum CBS 148.51]EAQ89857.1 predicted protein [Chaetomium globosum CBS 148.51]
MATATGDGAIARRSTRRSINAFSSTSSQSERKTSILKAIAAYHDTKDRTHLLQALSFIDCALGKSSNQEGRNVVDLLFTKPHEIDKEAASEVAEILRIPNLVYHPMSFAERSTWKERAKVILFLSATAGGTGLNIATASRLIICEPQFSPGSDSRLYRLPQIQDLSVYRVVGQSCAVDAYLVGNSVRKSEFERGPMTSRVPKVPR